MADESTSVQALKELFGKFVDDRDWGRFHSPKNLVMSLAVETAELMEHFLWMENAESRDVAADPDRRGEIADEIADVAGHIFCLCNVLGIDLSTAVRTKMAKNELKYPADQYRGRYEL